MLSLPVRIFSRVDIVAFKHFCLSFSCRVGSSPSLGYLSLSLKLLLSLLQIQQVTYHARLVVVLTFEDYAKDSVSVR